MREICLDSNVLVAAFASRGLCADVLRLVLDEFELVLPEGVADEVRRVLRDKIRLGEEADQAAADFFDRVPVVPRGNEPPPVDLRDPDDARVLADALRGGARLLVTGDQDLLEVAERSRVPILSPRAFLALVRFRSG